MERVRLALARIKNEPEQASQVLQEGFRTAPEEFGAGIGYFVAQALQGVVLAPENVPSDP